MSKIQWKLSDYKFAIDILKQMDHLSIETIAQRNTDIPLAILYHYAYELTKQKEFIERVKCLEEFYNAEIVKD